MRWGNGMVKKRGASKVSDFETRHACKTIIEYYRYVVNLQYIMYIYIYTYIYICTHCHDTKSFSSPWPSENQASSWPQDSTAVTSYRTYRVRDVTCDAQGFALPVLVTCDAQSPGALPVVETLKRNYLGCAGMMGLNMGHDIKFVGYCGRLGSNESNYGILWWNIIDK